jgi:ribosomal protein S18 acetylase RimI-like enzyme
MSFNPAIGFYKRLGFNVYGELDGTVLMQSDA